MVAKPRSDGAPTSKRSGLDRILHGSTLSQELRVGDHIDAVREGPGALAAGPDEAAARCRQGRSTSPRPRSVVVMCTATLRATRSIATRFASPDAFAGVPTQTKSTSARGNTIGGIHREPQALGGDLFVQQFLQSGLEEGTLAAPELPDLLLVLIQAHHGMAESGQGGGRHEPHVAGSDDDYAHRRPV